MYEILAKEIVDVQDVDTARSLIAVSDKHSRSSYQKLVPETYVPVSCLKNLMQVHVRFWYNRNCQNTTDQKNHTIIVFWMNLHQIFAARNCCKFLVKLVPDSGAGVTPISDWKQFWIKAGRRLSQWTRPGDRTDPVCSTPRLLVVVFWSCFHHWRSQTMHASFLWQNLNWNDTDIRADCATVTAEKPVKKYRFAPVLFCSGFKWCCNQTVMSINNHKNFVHQKGTIFSYQGHFRSKKNHQKLMHSFCVSTLDKLSRD